MTTLKDLQQIFPDATAETWHQHVNGNGWVENTTKVDDTVYVGPNAQVSGNARLCGNVWVFGNAWVATSARLTGKSQVTGDVVSGDVVYRGCPEKL